MVSAHNVLKVWWGRHTFHQFQRSCAQVLGQGVHRALSHMGKGVVMGNFPEDEFEKLKLEKQRRCFSGGDRKGAATKTGGVFRSLCSTVALWDMLIFCSALFLGAWNLSHPWEILWDIALPWVKEWCYLLGEVKQQHVSTWQNQDICGWFHGGCFWGGRRQED